MSFADLAMALCNRHTTCITTLDRCRGGQHQGGAGGGAMTCKQRLSASFEEPAGNFGDKYTVVLNSRERFEQIRYTPSMPAKRIGRNTSQLPVAADNEDK
jgi:hypothetical protein